LDNELQLTNSEELNNGLSSSTRSAEPIIDPSCLAKILIKDESYCVDENLKPQQKHVHPQNCSCSDTSMDVPYHKPHCRYFVIDSNENEVNSPLSCDVQETLKVESSGNQSSDCSTHDTEEEERIHIKENHFGDSTDENDCDPAYFKCLATIADDLSDELLSSTLNGNACIPTANESLITIREDLKLPLQVYSQHQENLTTVKLANMQVKRQCKKLRKVIDKLSEEKNPQMTFNISSERFLRRPGLQEYVESRDIQNLVQAVKKLNKTSSSSSRRVPSRRVPCKVM